MNLLFLPISAKNLKKPLVPNNLKHHKHNLAQQTWVNNWTRLLFQFLVISQDRKGSRMLEVLTWWVYLTVFNKVVAWESCYQCLWEIWLNRDKWIRFIVMSFKLSVAVRSLASLLRKTFHSSQLNVISLRKLYSKLLPLQDQEET